MTDTTMTGDPWAEYLEADDLRPQVRTILCDARDRFCARIAAGESAESALAVEKQRVSTELDALSKTLRRTAAEINASKNRAGRRARNGCGRSRHRKGR